MRRKFHDDCSKDEVLDNPGAFSGTEAVECCPMLQTVTKHNQTRSLKK